MSKHNQTEGTNNSDQPARSHLSRRGFLTVLGGATVALLQACGRTVPSTPTPTPGGTPSSTVPGITPTGTALSQAGTPSVTAATSPELHLPLISAGEPSATPTSTPTASPTASVTPVPGPTETPFPTATQRPIATPFPPGPPTKLGLFVGYTHPMIETLLRTGNVPFVKTLEYDPNFVEFVKQISPSTIVVARYTPLGDFTHNVTGDPKTAAREFVDFLLPIASEPKRFANIDAWESYNEPGVNTREAMQRFAEFEAERTRLLGEAGIRSCVGNFATGTPALELWPDFFPAVQAAKEHNGFLGLHEYSAPYMWFGSGPYQMEAGMDEGDEGWLTLRYRKVYRNHLQPAGLEVPLLITETGIDGQVQGRPGPQGLGWKDFVGYWEAQGSVDTTASGFYMEQLAWYDEELRKDPYVLGASIYALAAPIGWGSFEIDGQVADILQQYYEVHPLQG